MMAVSTTRPRPPAQRTAEAMAETTECKAAAWLGPPPEERR